MCTRPPTLQQSACSTVMGAPQPLQSCGMASRRRLYLSRRLSRNSSAESELLPLSPEPCSSGQDVPTFDGRFVDTPCIDKLLLAPQACRTAILAPADHTFTVVFQVQVIGVTMIKPTTSYLFYLIFFPHNRICGLAVAFKNNFFGGLPALPKKIPKSRCLGRAAPNQPKCQ